MSAAETAPPPFEPVNHVELTSIKDSKIIGVSVYSGRAEVTRLFQFDVKTGQNQVVISGLPGVIDQASFRVEGRGPATIHDVTLSTIDPPPVPTTSPKLKELLFKKKQTEKALQRTQRALVSLETYLNSLNAQHIEVTKLSGIVDNYDSTGGKLDDKVTELEATAESLHEEIEAERKELAGPKGNPKLNLKAAIGVFANTAGKVEIVLIYAVNDATWSAGYDIRVDMQTKEKPVTLIYKGAITQSTGEDWDDVSLTLETAAPTFGVGIPEISPWTLSIWRPPAMKRKSRGGFGSLAIGSDSGAPRGAASYRAREQHRPASIADEEYFSSISHRGLQVSSKGNISATFSVPGLMTIPSDGVAHNVTITRLNLDATMSWVCVPKQDTKTHLKAKIKNASEYTLLRGPASVYVDGSFISRSDVPAVSPEESFDCPLGLDPSIRVTYHPRVKKVSQSGFYNKNSNYVFTQRVTVFNTKSLPVENVKLIDQAPVAEDSLITVKLVSPPLELVPDASTSKSGPAAIKAPPPVKVASGVVAQWEGADEQMEEEDVRALGHDGKFNWVLSLPSQGKVNLVLQWEVSAPLRTDITGL